MLSLEERRKIFGQKKQKVDPNSGKIVAGFVNTSFAQFEAWFDASAFTQGCYYCGTTNELCRQLYDSQRNGVRPDATRGGKRGKRLELDRKDPNQSYDMLNNVVWCCYWCNNAKSNFFTEQEFLPIAQAIGVALRKINV